MAKESVLSTLSTRAKVGVGVVFVALIAVGYYIMFYSEVTSQIEAASNEQQRLRQDLTKARAAEHAYQKDLEELTDREQRLRDLNKILPATTEYPAFLSAVQNVANVAGVGLTAWTPKEEVREKYFARVPMKVELTGRYHQVAKFFYAVGQLDRIINMEDIALTTPRFVGDDVMLQASALATAFHAIEEEPQKAANQPGRPERPQRKRQ